MIEYKTDDEGICGAENERYEAWIYEDDSGDHDLILRDKKYDICVPGFAADLTAELEWSKKKVTDEDSRVFLKFAVEHPNAFEDAKRPHRHHWLG